MLPVLLQIFCSPFYVSAHSRPSQHLDNLSFPEADTIERDVAIIGGGSSGTHAAISLKDQGHSVIVVEKQGRFGGHTETYIDPTTGAPVDFGVTVFHNEDIVKNYFKRFNITLTEVSTINDNTYDFKTGQALNTAQGSLTEAGSAIAKYSQIVSQWPQLNDGMFLPDPIPEDLTIPFGDFVKKYNIEAAVSFVARINTGLGDILSIPVVENLRVVGLNLLQTVQGLLTTTRHMNSELYTKAQAELLSDKSLILNSHITRSERSENGTIKLIVKTPSGEKLIIAKKLLITIPPKVDILQPFDLDLREKDVFSKFHNTGYYTGIVKNSGIPGNLSLYNNNLNTLYNLPSLPGTLYILQTSAPDLHIASYTTPLTSSSNCLSENTVKSAIVRDIKMLQSSNPGRFKKTEPEFVAYSSHAPFYLQVKAEDIKKGFYKDLYALQGLRHTYWTGAAWRASDSSSLWRFNRDVVLPLIVEGL